MSSWLRREAGKFHAWNRPELEAFGLLVLAEVERRINEMPTRNIDFFKDKRRWLVIHRADTLAHIYSLREDK